MPHLWKTLSLGASRLLGRSLARLSPSEIEEIAYHYASRAGNAEGRAMETFVRGIANPTMGAIYDAALNGEALLMERTRGLGFSVIFDVGANQGDWAARLDVVGDFAELGKGLVVHLLDEDVEDAAAGQPDRER